MDSYMEAHYEALKESVADCVDQLSKLNAPRLKGWSDQLLAQWRATTNFPDYVFNRANLQSILIRFYNFYFTGTIPDGDSVHATVYDVVALARTNVGPIWRAEDHQGAGFYKPNTSIPRDFENIPVAAMPAVAALNVNWTQQQLDEYNARMANYNPANVTSFRRSVHERITAIDLVAGANRSELELLRLSSFLALTLLRFATKDKNQMGNVFLMKRYKTNLSTFAGWPAREAFAPPCSLCLDLCLKGLHNGSKHTSQIFIILAHEFVLTMNPEYENSSAADYLCCSVLTHTARHGLGMIQMLEATCSITRKTWKELMHLTYWSVTTKSWSYIMDFMCTQQKIHSKQYSFNWARIINNGYFREMSPKENVFLATVFAAVIEHVQGPGVWNANWAVGLKGKTNDAMLLGRELYSMCVST